jgi:small subunit ribosomal protein S18
MARDNKNTERKQSSRSNSKDKIVKAKACAFCKDNVKGIDYKDTNLLRKFISDRGKIRARRVTGNCTQHQRDIAMAVKNAREVALLPYTSTAR